MIPGRTNILLFKNTLIAEYRQFQAYSVWVFKICSCFEIVPKAILRARAKLKELWTYDGYILYNKEHKSAVLQNVIDNALFWCNNVRPGCNLNHIKYFSRKRVTKKWYCNLIQDPEYNSRNHNSLYLIIIPGKNVTDSSRWEKI